MKVKVNKDACIGCGACAAICDEVFELNDEGLSIVKESFKADEDGFYEIKDDLKDQAQDAIDSCPTGAIVTE